MPYRNGTKQEKLVQRCIEELGLRYVEQAKFGQYEVDFLLTELDVVVEADGPFGHLAKRDARRDQDLIGYGRCRSVAPERENFTGYKGKTMAGIKQISKSNSIVAPCCQG